MPRYLLQYRDAQFEVRSGEFVVGRDPSCAFVLDGPSVSRRHARFILDDGRLSIEDLGSRNGVSLNGVRIRGPELLAGGDIVSIGDEKLKVQIAGSMIPGIAVTAVTQVSSRARAAIIMPLVDKALALSQFDEAERLLASTVDDMVAGAKMGLIDRDALGQWSQLALRTAKQTGSAPLVDGVFTAFRMAACVPAIPIIDELHLVTRKHRLGFSDAFRSYLEAMHARTTPLAPTDAFALQRLDALARVLRA